MNPCFIKLNNICLDYFHYTKRYSLKKTILKSAFGLLKGNEPTIQSSRALDGIDATFQTGDRIALMGKNGSGKSTLLRVLSGIYTPTKGSLQVSGSISSLLDISVGLHPESTGYENIIIMGVLQRKTPKQMKAKFEDIEEFTELKDYLHMPVRTYSSGMRLRLAFAIATCMESDILIIDEVIGVGDRMFMTKSQERLKNMVHKSQILVLTSHATQILHQFCNKGMILSQGKCQFFGDLQQSIDLYEATK